MPDRSPLLSTIHPFRWRGADAELSVVATSPTGDAVDRALTLTPLLPLAPALEAWLGEPLRLGAPRAQAADGLLTIEVGPEGQAPLCGIALPAALLPAGLSATFASPWTLRWPKVVCDLVLDDWPAEAIAMARLAPGAMLLMPRSFAAEARAWAVRLAPALADIRQVRPGPAQRCVLWQSDEAVLRMGKLDPESLPPARPWTAVLPRAATPGADGWCGLVAKDQWLPIDTGRIELRLNSRTVAHGRLAPAGLGYGLLIEEVAHDAMAGPSARVAAGLASPTAAWT